MGSLDRIPRMITENSRIMLVVMLVLTGAIAAGAPLVDDDTSLEQFEAEYEETDAAEYISQNFESPGDENTTSVQIIPREDGGNVLTQDSVVQSLELQQQIQESEIIAETLAEENPIFGIENLIGASAVQQAQTGENNVETQQQTQSQSVQDQIDAVEQLDSDEYRELVNATFYEQQTQVERFLPTAFEYEYGSGELPESESRLTSVTQLTDGDANIEAGEAQQQLVDSQLEIRDLANQQEQDYVVFGLGILTDEIDRSLGDSIAIVGPLALIFVVVALSIAYRDPLDIILGVVGIIAVLLWTFGFMGWTGISFNQMMIAAPVLLIGLSIDYAIHVFMRHREQRQAGAVSDTISTSMKVALAGVGIALIWVTATAAIGFLANLISPIGPLGDFGLVTAFGIFAALLVFGLLVPAAKIELDTLLENRGYDRKKRAFGTGGGVLSRGLSVGTTAAKKTPIVVLVIVALLTTGGIVGATQIDTSFQQEDFLADSPPSWTQNLPSPFAPGEYQIKSDLDFISANYQAEGSQANILIREDDPGTQTGVVTADDVLVEVHEAQQEAAESDTVFIGAGGEPSVSSPLTVVQTAAATAEAAIDSAEAAGEQPPPEATSYLETYQSSLNDEGVPEGNIEQLYDDLFAFANTEAGAELTPGQTIYQTDNGDYEAVQMLIGTQGTADFGDITEDMRGIADGVQTEGYVIATGDPIINWLVEQDLLDTVFQTLLLTLVAVFLFLTVAYRLVGNGAMLGFVTLLPVVLAVSWILGTMYLLDIPFNVMTGMITSLTIGLGVAYSIHISSRYTLELSRQGNVWEAMQTTVTGTGGALLGSAATTVGGFGTLALAILPIIQQFGIVTGLTIIYTFLASVLVLPTLLIIWTRYFGPDISFEMNSVVSTGDGETTPQTED